MATAGCSAVRIERELQLSDEFADRDLPHTRTIQRIVHDVNRDDSSGAWSPIEGPVDDTAAVLPVLAAVIERTEGRRTYLTKAEATFCGRLARATTLRPWTAFGLARAYLARQADGVETTDLDAFVAYFGRRVRTGSTTRSTVTRTLCPRAG